MPEGPSIVIAREELAPFAGKKVLSAKSNAKINFTLLKNKKIVSVRSWGKHLLICFNGLFLRVHFMMFGSYLVNARKEMQPRVQLKFSTGEINFYSCSVRLITGDVEHEYDWQTDVMSTEWSPAKARKKLRKIKSTIADALLNQDVFAGVGNIIKNEVLFRVRVHPATSVHALPTKKVVQIVREARQYSFDFYEWKKIFQLRKHWLIYKKKICPRCDLPVVREFLGSTNRLTFYCPNCQYLYTSDSPD